MADDLQSLLRVARKNAPEVDHAAWVRVENALRQEFGAQKIYIASRKKKHQLDVLENAPPDADAKQLSRMLGVTVQHARRLKKLV